MRDTKQINISIPVLFSGDSRGRSKSGGKTAKCKVIYDPGPLTLKFMGIQDTVSKIIKLFSPQKLSDYIVELVEEINSKNKTRPGKMM